MIAFDSNILVYSVDLLEPERQPIAFSLVARAAEGRAMIAVQALGEFMNVCRRRGLMPSAGTRERIEDWCAVFEVRQTRARDLVAASRLSERYNLQFFDALICAVSREAGATTLLSEDMQDGLDVGGITVVNPFAPANAARVEEALTHGC